MKLNQVSRIMAGADAVKAVYVGSNKVWPVQATYVSEVLSDSPLGVWLMNEEAGSTMYDLSPSQAHGTYSAGVELGVEGPGGFFDLAASFGNAGSYSSVPIDLSSAHDITVEWWMRVSPWPTTNDIIMSLSNGQSAGEFVVHTYASPHDFMVSVAPQTGGSFRTVSGTRSSAEWEFWSMVISRKSGNANDMISLRRNGVEIPLSNFNNNTNPGGYFASSQFYFMGRPGAVMNGKAAGLAIFPSWLSNERRDAHYLIGLPFEPEVLSYEEEVLLDNPEGFWLLDESGGTMANDSSGNSRDIVLSGSYERADLKSGILGTSFSGGKGYRPYESWMSDIKNPSTIELWFYKKTIASGVEVLVGQMDGGDGSSMDRWGLYLDTGGRIQYYRRTPGKKEVITPISSYVGGQWIHLVVVSDMTDTTIWINGIESVKESTDLSPVAKLAPLWIAGHRNQYTHYPYSFMGTLSRVAIYKKALSSNRIVDHYRAGLHKGSFLDIFDRADGPLESPWEFYESSPSTPAAFEITSNTARTTSSSGSSVSIVAAIVNLDDPVGRTEWDMTLWPKGPTYCFFRFVDINNYWFISGTGASANQIYLFRCIGGSFTVMATSSVSWGAGYRLAVIDTGSVISVTVDGSPVPGFTVTSSIHSSANRSGIGGNVQSSDSYIPYLQSAQWSRFYMEPRP